MGGENAVVLNNHSADSNIKILVIDDEPTIVDFLSVGLGYEGFEVRACYDGLTALNEARQWQPDLIILDLMLPTVDGMEVCRILRSGTDVPIIMLTAKESIEDRVQGLNLGADDYITKPFAFQELVARVRAVLRRHHRDPGQQQQVITVGDLTLNRNTREVTRNNRQVTLTAKEFELMELFMSHLDQVLTRDVILERIWGYDFNGETNIIDVYIRQLRQKLDDNPPRLIQTVRGVGYILRAEASMRG